MKNKYSYLARIVVSVGLLILLAWLMRKDARNIFETIARCELKYIWTALALFLLNSVIVAYRMKVVFRGENLDLAMFESVQLTFIGYFFNNFMPTAVGGDIVKAHYASVENRSKMRSYASVMMDRIIGLYSFFVVAAVAIFFNRARGEVDAVKNIIFVFLFAGIAMFVVLCSRRVAMMMENFFRKIKMGSLGAKLDELYKIVHDYRNRRAVVAKSLMASVIAQSVYFITVYMLFLSLGLSVNLGRLFIIMPVVSFISMIPSVGGLGVREGAMVAFFSPIVGKEQAFAVSILLLFGLFFTSLLGGFFYLHWIVTRRNERGENEK